MGWKAVKDHYRIGHIVQRTEKGLCIGSGYIHDIMIIDANGKLIKRFDGHNEDLNRYQREMDEDPALLASLLAAPDTFEESITVYTYDDADIIERQCEEPGWPNVTHDGYAMYENTYSTDKVKVVQWAKESADAWIESAQRQVNELTEQLEAREKHLTDALNMKTRLDQNYPE